MPPGLINWHLPLVLLSPGLMLLLAYPALCLLDASRMRRLLGCCMLILALLLALSLLDAAARSGVLWQTLGIIQLGILPLFLALGLALWQAWKSRHSSHCLIDSGLAYLIVISLLPFWMLVLWPRIENPRRASLYALGCLLSLLLGLFLSAPVAYLLAGLSLSYALPQWRLAGLGVLACSLPLIFWGGLP